MYYKIGEFANMMGVPAATIRFYEKLGIVKSIKDKNNNYRYFHDLDARNLLWCRWYRGIGIPLPDVAKIMNNYSLDEIVGTLEQRENELINEIKKNQQLLAKINEICKRKDDIHSLKDICIIENSPAFYRLKQTINNSLIPNNAKDSIVNEWINMVPFTYFSVVIPKKNLYSENNDIDYSWGIAITEKEAEEHKLHIDEKAEFYPEKKCVTSIISKFESDLIKLKDIKHMINYINEKDLKINGDCMGKLLLREKNNGELIYYFSFHIPVE